MRIFIAYAVVLIFAIAMSIQPAGAVAIISTPFMSTPCTGFTFPNSNSALTITEFNQASLTNHDFETMDLKYPAFGDGIVLGPAIGPLAADGIALGTGATANVLPFGLVNLAFPSLNQTVLDTCAAQRTYFFTDTLG